MSISGKENREKSREEGRESSVFNRSDLSIRT
jgi:hypothetical protein